MISGVSIPFVDSIQLDLEGSLVLLYHILEWYRGMLCVFSLCTLPAHGCLTGLAVKLHHLQKCTTLNSNMAGVISLKAYLIGS